MNYRKATQNLSNVKIADWSPRKDGETEARSDWKEVKDLPGAYQDRLALLKKLAAEKSEVHMRPATTYGRARIWTKQ